MHLPSANVERIGLFAARAATLAAPFVIFLALPPFYNGIWGQVEGALPWLHGLGGIGALGCGLMAVSGNSLATAALLHPMVLFPAAIFAVAVLLMPAAVLPALSLFGAPEHGFGALVYLDLAALTAAAFVVFADTTWRRLVLAVALCVVAAAFVLDGLFRLEQTWAPFFFGDYLAFYAVFTFAILGVLARGRRLWFAAAAILLIASCLMSSNKASVLALGAGFALLPMVTRIRSNRAVAMVCAGYPILVGIAIIVIGSAWREPYREELGAIGWPGPLANLIADSWASLWSRAMLVVVGAQTLIDSPWRVLTGIGWGHYNETLLANLPIVEGRLHELIGPSRVYWDAIRRVDFHSHNQYFEALLSGGIVSAGLVLAYGAAMVRYAAADNRKLAFFVALVLAVLQSFWFQMPHTLPVMVFAIVMLTDGITVDSRACRREGWVAPGCAIAAAAILFLGGTMSILASKDVASALKDIKQAGELPADFKIERRFSAGLDEIYDASLLQTAYALDVGESKRVASLDGRPYDILRQMLRRTLDSPPASLKGSISTVNVLSGIIFMVPDTESRFGDLSEQYRDRVEALMRRAPRRSDIAIPYFNYLLARKREKEALDLANRILARHENSAVALWFSGIVLLGNADTSAAGMANLKRSLAQGIRNLMPIDRGILQEIDR